MNVLNFATPTLENIKCTKPLVSQVFCQLPKKTILHSNTLQIHPYNKSCRKSHILKNNTCYKFSWHRLDKRIQESCPSKRFNSVSINHFKYFEYLFDAVTDFKRNDYIIKIIIAGCTFNLIFATSIVILLWLKSGKMPNVYCSPFFDTSSAFSLDEPLAWLIIGVNFIAVSLNLIFHSKLIAEVITYKNNNLRAKSRNQFKMSLLIQIIFMTCSHLLCWVSGIIVLLISIFQRIYPIEIILLKLVRIESLNSILIPFLFITKKIRTLLSQSK